VVHGFGGSARLMYGFADTLARRGYVVVLPDLAGHGGNTRRLPDEPDSAPDRDAVVDRDVAAAVDHLRGLSEVDPSAVMLLGHSMGAAAVIRYATTNGDRVRATVAVSTSDPVPPFGQGGPRNLLVVAGSAEFAVYRDAALATTRLARPGTGWDETIGDAAAGTARRAVSVPGTEHVAVLFAGRTHREAVGWLDAAVGRVGVTGRVHPVRRLLGGGLLLVAFLAGFYPVSYLSGWRGPRRPDRPVTLRLAVAALALGLVLAAALAGALPTTRLPLAVGGYLVGFFALAGLGMLIASTVDAQWPRSTLAALPRLRWADTVARLRDRWAPRASTVAAVLVCYATVAVALPMHVGLTSAVPVGARWWLLPIMAGGTAVLLAGAEAASGGRTVRYAAMLLATAGALLVCAIAGRAPWFVVLVLPLLVGLFLWQAGFAAVMRRGGAPGWAVTAVGAVLVAWPIATTLPLA
jgi:pimeloyl-ACP methyl ester carboxylesterase